MKKIILIKIAIILSFNANAAIIVYDGNGNKQDTQYLVNHDIIKNTTKPETLEKRKAGEIPYPGELTEDDLKTMSKADFNRYIKQVPDSHRDIEKQKLRGLGTAILFFDYNSASENLANTINNLAAMSNDGLKFQVYMKPTKSMMSMGTTAIKFKIPLDTSFSIDSGNKNARRLHVDSYPQIIYLATDGSKARYAATGGGLTALKMKIGEVKTMLQMQEQQKNQPQY